MRSVCAATAGLIALWGAIAAYGQRAAESTTHHYEVSSRRIAVYRSYNPGEAPMTVCADKDCRTVSNDSAVAFSVLHPHFLVFDKPASRLSVTTRHDAPKPVIHALPHPPQVLGAGLYEEGHEAIDYRGNWILQTREGPSFQTIRTAIEHDSFVEFRFEGSAFEIGVLTYDDRHLLKLCVDDRCTSRDLFSQGLHWQVPIAVTGLNPGVHTVRMSLERGKAIDLDWVRVFPQREPLRAGRHGRDGPQYSTGWYIFVDFMRSERQPSLFFFDFIGKRVTFRLRTGGDYAETHFCIDAVCQTHDLYSYHPGWRDIELVAPSDGRHHVVVEKGKARVLGLASMTIE